MPIASAIADKLHLKVFEDLAANRLDALPVEKVLIYIIDTVDADALFTLAKQFDLLGYKGWKLAKNEAEQRTLLKKAIELHRYKGTPYAVKEAVKSTGLFDAIIEEGFGAYYDGDVDYDGSINYGEGNWALFRVIFDLGNSAGITQEQTDELVALVNEYKNVRSKLMDIQWQATMSDEATMTDEFTMDIAITGFVDPISDGLDYDGAGIYFGLDNYDRYGDEVTSNL